MQRECEDCGTVYNDEFSSTLCPHRGIGYCAVCDCVVCVCTKDNSPNWKRSSNNRESA